MSKVSKLFLMYTFIIMAICWGTCMAFSFSGLLLNKDFPLYVPYLIGGWSPTIASYIVLKKNDRVKSFKEWLKNVFDFKHGLASYILVIVLFVLYVLPQCIVAGYEKGAPSYALIVLLPVRFTRFMMVL
ncbi:hypothetical protein CIY_32320 [Butyrivibrio fibrisolvens 16/4]|nr:hypothetical protein CIY_32320 [Butyrivibrio fibrisolvens 16/4]